MFTDYLLLLTVCTNNYNAILRLRIDFCLVSSCFMQKLNSGSMGNLAQVQVLLYLATSQEMVRKKRSFKVREKSRNLIEVGGNLCFSETLGRIYFFTNSGT